MTGILRRKTVSISLMVALHVVYPLNIHEDAIKRPVRFYAIHRLLTVNIRQDRVSVHAEATFENFAVDVVVLDFAELGERRGLKRAVKRSPAHLHD
jgi:hypothetical protein